MKTRLIQCPINEFNVSRWYKTWLIFLTTIFYSCNSIMTTACALMHNSSFDFTCLNVSHYHNEQSEKNTGSPHQIKCATPVRWNCTLIYFCKLDLSKQVYLLSFRHLPHSPNQKWQLFKWAGKSDGRKDTSEEATQRWPYSQRTQTVCRHVKTSTCSARTA
jgi:hypothetical protein